MNYENQRVWSDKFTSEAMSLIHNNSHLLPKPQVRFSVSISDEMRDMKQATDAIITQTGELCVALRVRRNKFLTSYKNEFTIRIKSRGDGPSELDKIKAGFCQVYFYGFANQNDDGFSFWRIIDVHLFRKWLKRMEAKGIDRPYSIIDNHDGTMGGAFKIKDSLADCVIVDSTMKDTNQLALF